MGRHTRRAPFSAVLFRVGAGLAVVWLGACSGDDERATSGGADETNEGGSSGVGASGPAAIPAIYAPEHVLEVSVELGAVDWSALRAEGRSLFDVFLGVNEAYEYSEFQGSATVDGERYENVSISKKGYLGSLSVLRPSIKLDFGADAAANEARGFRRLTLNNNRQDPTHARQCLAYGLFAKAGLPAPSCNLAHVSVNGEDLGTFSNIEPIKKGFLARHFSSDAGNLYEGQTVDFTPGSAAEFQLKTNEAENDRSDIQRLIEALQADDSDLVQRLSEVIDLERYRDFWALETLAGHWDGYDGNRNNYYVYSDPQSQRLHFIPWGTDGSFADANPADASNATHTVFARGLIANRLYNLPEQRARFRARLAELVDQLWDESELVGELERLTAQAPDAWPAATSALRLFLQTHGTQVRVELDQPAWEWVEGSAVPSPCFGTQGDVNVEFTTDYGDLAALAPTMGNFQVGLSMDGAPFEGSWFGRAGVDAAATEPGVLLRMVAFSADGTGVLLQLTLPPSELVPGTHPLYALESFGLVLVLAGADTRLVGFVSDGVLELDSASSALGAAVSGRLNARLLQLGCANL